MKNINILFVCTGNTCRSPMAEYLAKKRASETGIPISVSSAGLTALKGDPASDEALKVMSEIGIDISPHRATPFSPEIASKADFIFAMTQRHLDMILLFFPSVAGKARLLGKEDITDPYGRDADVYRKTRDEIDGAIKIRFAEICGSSDV